MVVSAIRIIGNVLIEQDCSVYASQMRVRIDPSKYLYPDASIVCGQPEFADDNEVTPAQSYRRGRSDVAFLIHPRPPDQA